jgi:hypothetical protein
LLLVLHLLFLLSSSNDQWSGSKSKIVE